MFDTNKHDTYISMTIFFIQFQFKCKLNFLKYQAAKLMMIGLI